MTPLANEFSVALPNGKRVTISTDDAATASQAAARYWEKTTGETINPSELVVTGGPKVPKEPDVIPERGFGEEVVRQLGMGTRDVIQGAAAIPGLVYDAFALPFQAGIAGARGLGLTDRPYLKPASAQLATGLTAAGLPLPETAGERIRSMAVQGVASALPTLGTGAFSAPGTIGAKLAAQPVSQITGGLAGGTAAQSAAELDAPPAVQAGVGLVGGIAGASVPAAAFATGRAAKALVQPITQAGRERMAADVLLRSSAAPGALASRIEEGIEDTARRLPGSPVTTAQAARDPGLMVLEQGLAADAGRVAGQRGQSGAVALRDAQARRNQVRLAALDMPDDSVSAGTTLRSVLGEARTKAAARVRAAFNNVDPDGTIVLPIDDVAGPIVTAGFRKYGEGAGQMPPALSQIMDEIVENTNQGTGVGWLWFQNMRSRLGNEAGKARLAGDRTAAESYSDMRVALEGVVETFAKQGRGFTPQQQSAWRRAIAMRRGMGEKFERSVEGGTAVASILKTDRFGRPVLEDSKIVAKALSSPEGLQQVIKAAGGAKNDVQAALRNEFLRRGLERAETSGVIADAAGNVTTQLSTAGFLKYINNPINRRLSAQLFDSPEQAQRIKRLVDDFAEGSMVATTGKARGSDTAQNLSVANLISITTRGVVDPNTSLGTMKLLRVLDWALPEAAIRELIIEAAANPVFARQLLARAGPDSVERAATGLRRFQDTFRNVAAGAVARQAVRSAGIAGAEQPR